MIEDKDREDQVDDKKLLWGKVSDIAKEDAHGWTTKDAPGEFRMVPKKLLHIDHAYQRDKVNCARVLKVARCFSWVAFGCLIVGERDDGTLWVIDGQHRKLAADRRESIDLLPCMVFKRPDLVAEAEGFLDINIDRGAVKTYHQFRALVVAEDPLALAVNAMVAAQGYNVGNGGTRPYYVACIKAIMDQYKEDSDICQRVWKLCAEVCKGAGVHKNLFAGLCYLERFCDRKGHGSVCDPMYRARMVSQGQDEILARINKAVRLHEKGGPKVWGEGIRMFLNSGRRTNLIPSIIESEE